MGGKIKKRWKTLFVPYILWCIAAIVYDHFVKHVSWPESVWQWLMQFWDAGTGSGHPIGKAMWYIKSLIVFAVLSPLYYYAIRYLKHFVLIAVLVLFSLNIPIDFPWFNVWLLLGAYIAIMGLTLKDIIDKMDWRLCLGVWIGLKVLLFVGVLPFNLEIPMSLCCFIGLFGLLMKWDITTVLASTSSFIYFAHPYLTGIRTVFIKFVDDSSIIGVLTVWALTAIAVVIICCTAFFFMRRFTPRLLSIITGDRI